MLHPLPSSTAGVLRPRHFTYPYQYTPHPLCVAAADEVRSYLTSRPHLNEAAQEGKMFGVLIVTDATDRLYFLAAYSGELAGDNSWPWFVPPVYDLLHPESYFQEEQRNISCINATVARLQEEYGNENTQILLKIKQLKEERKTRSQSLQQWLFAQYRMLNAEGEESNILQIFDEYYTHHSPVSTTSKKSNASTPKLPPSGSGECCAPKLLQAAFRAHLHPVAMAEFWVGRPPKDELRIDGHYYPACSGKCRPILGHMLRGLDVEPNPLQQKNLDIARQLRVLYSDESLAVIDKPSGMLAVPGVDPELPNVYDEVRRRFPQAQGPIIVHRLDMDTSGLMVVAFTDDAYHNLQQQFVQHTIQKRYVALLESSKSALAITSSSPNARSLEGAPDAQREGTISLPICPNPYDRPRQMVSEQYGKRAVTRYAMVDSIHVHLWPETGRTHQLRVHCAHPDGLARPIVGDNLYGTASDRLCLHADTLVFDHPVTGRRVSYHSPAPF